MSFINYNGEILNHAVPLTTNNRAFRYGDGLFESIRSFDGNIPFLRQHLNRLTQGMKVLAYNKCDCLSEDRLLSQITDLLQKNEILGSAKIRLTVFRKDGGLYAAEDNDFNYIIEVQELEHTLFSLQAKGLILGIAKEITKPINQLSELKTTNALLMVLAAKEAKKKSWDDALILNSNGTIAEATSSNLFIVKAQTIFTPPIEDGAMNGIMRQQIAHIVKQSDYKLRVKSLNPKDIGEADEIFLTNAIRGIIWVVGYGKKRFYNKAAKKLTTLLNAYTQELMEIEE